VDINSRLSIHSSLVEGGSIRGPIIVFFFSLDICRISVCRGFFACCWSEDTQPFIIYFPCSEMLAVVYGLERLGLGDSVLVGISGMLIFLSFVV